MERKFKFAPDEYYHVFNRGNNKTDIFLSDSDRRRFQKLLFFCNSTEPVITKTIQGPTLDKIKRTGQLVDIGAYCLMPNHFHILFKERTENGISLFMQKLSTAYSMYFNKRNERTGGLFEGKFKAVHVDSDEYLKYLFAYIHLNPVKMIDPEWKENGIADTEEAQNYLEKYSYSSYLDYTGMKREEGSILDINAFPQYFADFKEFDEFINEWLSCPRSDLG